MKSWNACKKILCVRADNMGDILMSGPAIRALKESFDCSITLLTSSLGAVIAPCLLYVDEVITANLPWVKANDSLNAEACADLIDQLKERSFDGAVIFTAYSQSALPAALLTFMAAIPLRLAYCRENPYELLTHWVPDKEPYSFILHQVERDLNLVNAIGATTGDDRLFINIRETARESAAVKLHEAGIYPPYIILHTGVSEAKREYPAERWIETIELLDKKFGLPLLLTGSKSEKAQADHIRDASGNRAHSVAGLLDIEEFAAAIELASLVVSVNTATVHIAAATGTPVVVLYAETNPQHTPWKVPCKVLRFPVPKKLRSRNEVIGYVSEKLYSGTSSIPTPEDIFEAAANGLEHCKEITNNKSQIPNKF